MDAFIDIFWTTHYKYPTLYRRHNGPIYLYFYTRHRNNTGRTNIKHWAMGVNCGYCEFPAVWRYRTLSRKIKYCMDFRCFIGLRIDRYHVCLSFESDWERSFYQPYRHFGVSIDICILLPPELSLPSWSLDNIASSRLISLETRMFVLELTGLMAKDQSKFCITDPLCRESVPGTGGFPHTGPVMWKGCLCRDVNMENHGQWIINALITAYGHIFLRDK